MIQVSHVAQWWSRLERLRLLRFKSLSCVCVCQGSLMQCCLLQASLAFAKHRTDAEVRQVLEEVREQNPASDER